MLLVCNGGTAGTGVGVRRYQPGALLLRGGEAVVAASRLLNDELAAQWSLALYSARSRGRPPFCNHTAPDLLKAFHAAQITMRERRPSDWSTLRLFVPSRPGGSGRQARSALPCSPVQGTQRQYCACCLRRRGG